MTFPSILPYLQAGRRVRRASWTTSVWLRDGVDADIHDLLSSDWELVEEPKKVYEFTDAEGVVHSSDLAASVMARDATITRLTRELADAKAALAAIRLLLP